MTNKKKDCPNVFTFLVSLEFKSYHGIDFSILLISLFRTSCIFIPIGLASSVLTSVLISLLFSPVLLIFGPCQTTLRIKSSSTSLFYFFLSVAGDGWFLLQVTVKPENEEDPYVFVCNR